MKQVGCVCRLRRNAEIKAFLYECNVYFIYGFYDAFFAKYTYTSTLFFSIRELRILCRNLPKSALLSSSFILPRKRNPIYKAKKILRKNHGSKKRNLIYYNDLGCMYVIFGTPRESKPYHLKRQF